MSRDCQETRSLNRFRHALIESDNPVRLKIGVPAAIAGSRMCDPRAGVSFDADIWVPLAQHSFQRVFPIVTGADDADLPAAGRRGDGLPERLQQIGPLDESAGIGIGDENRAISQKRMMSIEDDPGNGRQRENYGDHCRQASIEAFEKQADAGADHHEQGKMKPCVPGLPAQVGTQSDERQYDGCKM